MRIRRIDKANQIVELHDGKRDLNYHFIAGGLVVSYRTERRKKEGRYVVMFRTLNPTGAKAREIRKILEAAE